MTIFNRPHDFYMNKALDQARKAVEKDEVPIGAVVVNREGKIIARAHNMVEKNNTQMAHAEIIALSKASKRLGDWRLLGCWLYVTLEPCAMCFHAALLSRIEGIVFGAPSPLFGFHLDKTWTVSIYKDSRLPLEIIEGVGASQATYLLQQFFKRKRNESN